VTARASRSRGSFRVLYLCACALPLLDGCTLYNRVFHRSHDNGCREKPFQGDTTNLPGLSVPEGLTPPDARNQVKIPSLNASERVRAKSEPCLAQPPSYGSGGSIALPVRSGTPMGAPAPAPVPVSPVEPTTPVDSGQPAVPLPPIGTTPPDTQAPPRVPEPPPAAPPQSPSPEPEPRPTP
jgi:hypothetical protein